jgi:hypothetical protein
METSKKQIFLVVDKIELVGQMPIHLPEGSHLYGWGKPTALVWLKNFPINTMALS